MNKVLNSLLHSWDESVLEHKTKSPLVYGPIVNYSLIVLDFKPELSLKRL